MPNQCESIRAGCRAVAVCAVWPVGVGVFFVGTGDKKSRREMGSGVGTFAHGEFVFFAR